GKKVENTESNDRGTAENHRDSLSAARREIQHKGKRQQYYGDAPQRCRQAYSDRYAQQHNSGQPFTRAGIDRMRNPDGGVDQTKAAPGENNFWPDMATDRDHGRREAIKRQSDVSPFIAEQASGYPPKSCSQPAAKHHKWKTQQPSRGDHQGCFD